MVSHRAMRRGFAMLDAILGGVLLAVGLAAVVTLASRSLQMERRGEREVVAAALLDEILTEVLVEGPVDYPKVFDTAGACEARSRIGSSRWSSKPRASGIRIA